MKFQPDQELEGILHKSKPICGQMNGSSSKNHSKGACNNKKGIDEETEVRALASLYSQTPQYRRSWDWPKSGGIPKTAVLGVIYNLQHPYLGLENGRRYWEGGGMGGRRYWGGGDDCKL